MAAVASSNEDAIAARDLREDIDTSRRVVLQLGEGGASHPAMKSGQSAPDSAARYILRKSFAVQFVRTHELISESGQGTVIHRTSRTVK
jgi:hypothetical protein